VEAAKQKSQLTKNLFSLTLVQVATYILPLVSVPIISRIIGPGKFGLINFGVAYISYFTLIISYSFDFTATRKITKDPGNEQNRNEVFSEVFYTQCLLFLISTITFIILLLTVSQFKENATLLIFSYTLCISTLFTQNWLFQAMQDLDKVAIFNVISKVIFTIAILVVIRKNEDYIWQPLLIGLIQTAIAIWSFFWSIKRYHIKLLKFDIKRCWRVLVEEKMIFFSLIFVNLYTYTNTIILGLFQNEVQVGYYTAAQRLILIAQSVLAMPLAQAFYPFIGKAFGESREKGLILAQKLIPLIIIFTGVASIFILVLGPFVIRIFYGAKFDHSIPIFQLLAIIPLLFSLNNVLGIQIMVNLGMDKQFFLISAAAGVFSVLLNLLIVRHWGYIGTTFNWLFTEVFLFTTMFFVLKKANLNPINFSYFRLSSLKEYISPLRNKIPFINLKKNG